MSKSNIKRTHDEAFDHGSTSQETIDLDADDEVLVPPVLDEGPNDSEKLAKIQCVICLDNPTDLTATPCGKCEVGRIVLTCRTHILPYLHYGGAFCW
jgi:hypothetical protein